MSLWHSWLSLYRWLTFFCRIWLEHYFLNSIRWGTVMCWLPWSRRAAEPGVLTGETTGAITTPLKLMSPTSQLPTILTAANSVPRTQRKPLTRMEPQTRIGTHTSLCTRKMYSYSSSLRQTRSYQQNNCPPCILFIIIFHMHVQLLPFPVWCRLHHNYPQPSTRQQHAMSTSLTLSPKDVQTCP